VEALVTAYFVEFFFHALRGIRARGKTGV